MRQHLKAVIWPRKPVGEEKPNYRYIITGMLVTDEPIPEFEGKAEIVMDHGVAGIAERLTELPQRKSKIRIGTADDVLLRLERI